MNKPAAADEPVVETEGGNAIPPKHDRFPELEGKYGEEPETKPEADVEPDEDEQKAGSEADSPSADEENVDETESDDAKLKARIGELAYENRQLKRQLEQRRQQAPDGTDQPEKLKTIEDFDHDQERYQRYLLDEGRKQGQREAEAGAEPEVDPVQAEFDKRIATFEVDNPGFEERLRDPKLPITAEMAAFISDPDSDVGLHVGDWLTKNPTEAARIAALTPAQQSREMVKVEARIKKEVAKVAQEKSKTSKAPEPAKPLDGTGDPSTKPDPSSTDSDKMSDKDWLAARRKQVAKKRGH